MTPRIPRGTHLPLLPLGPGGVQQVSAILGATRIVAYLAELVKSFLLFFVELWKVIWITLGPLEQKNGPHPTKACLFTACACQTCHWLWTRLPLVKSPLCMSFLIISKWACLIMLFTCILNRDRANAVKGMSDMFCMSFYENQQVNGVNKDVDNRISSCACFGFETCKHTCLWALQHASMLTSLLLSW